jgi:thiamine pyrophosphate-dependent acetolactate synthase large subunit-like protein
MGVEETASARARRARMLAEHGGIDGALAAGALPPVVDITLAEGIVLGLLRQGVRRYVVVLGHGSTELGEVLRIYEAEGLVRTFAVRSEVEASHAATALRWITGLKAAVVTSIGPGAMHAFAGSLAAASNGLGVWYLFGDETTHDEGPNMQQVPRHEQHQFHRMCSTLGGAYSLHTPEALGTALRRGLRHVDDPHFGGPFFLLMPMNTQPAVLGGFHLDQLPAGPPPAMGAAAGDDVYDEAAAALHYARTTPLVGDVTATLRQLCTRLRQRGAASQAGESAWMRSCAARRAEWEAFKAERYEHPTLADEVWGRDVLTQPAAIKVATDWARETGAVSLFDAGDVQANGFQVVEDEREGQTYSETGASYMGFAVSGLLATALADEPFYGLALTGDGSFMMNPQVLIDGVEHGATGCILLLDNRRMAAISSLQRAQYGADHATHDSVAVDYVKLASSFDGVLALPGGHSPDELRAALDLARAHQGLSLIHVPVYFGSDPLGGLGAYGRWNVGSWVDEVQALRGKIGL